MLHEKYEFWEVCKDPEETSDILSIGSIWGQEWYGINEYMRNMSDEEIRNMLKSDIELYEVVNFQKVDKRKIKSAIRELKYILNLY